MTGLEDDECPHGLTLETCDQSIPEGRDVTNEVVRTRAGRQLDAELSSMLRRSRDVAVLVRPDRFVAGAVGPIGKTIAPMGQTPRAEARAAFVEQITALVEAGVDLLMLETFSNLTEMTEAVQAARQVAPELPLVAQMTFTEDGVTMSGDTPADVVAALEPLGVDLIGANCSVGSSPMLGVVEAMAGVASGPLSAQPNAGFPTVVDGRFMYLSSPQYMAEYAQRKRRSGEREGEGQRLGAVAAKPGQSRAAASAPDIERTTPSMSSITSILSNRSTRKPSARSFAVRSTSAARSASVPCVAPSTSMMSLASRQRKSAK